MKTALFLTLALFAGHAALAATTDPMLDSTPTLASADTPLDHDCPCLHATDCEDATMDRTDAKKLVIPGLDPGINRTVHFLVGAGFTTTDSGDGKTKLAEGWSPDEARDVPHVSMVCDPADLVASCDTLRSVLERQGVSVVAAKPPDEPYLPGEAVIEGVYLVGASVAVIDLTRLDDAGLLHARTRGRG